MGHQHGIRGGEGALPEHCNTTQNQPKTPPVQPLLRLGVAPDNMKTVHLKKTIAPA